MQPSVKPKNIYGWHGLSMFSGDLEIGLIPLGGRIISLKYQGQELLFIDPEHRGEIFDSFNGKDLVQAKVEMGFRVWGGDKTWVAPQKEWILGIPPLDLDAAPYQYNIQNKSIIMTSEVCRETGLQIIRSVSLQDSQVHLKEEMYNRGSKTVKKGLWNVTQIPRPCIFEISCGKGSFHSYHHEDKSLPAFKGDLSPKLGSLKIPCEHKDLFKIGGIPLKGEVLIHIKRQGSKISWKKSFFLDPQSEYAHGSAVEIFNSPKQDYAEIEIHAPFKTIPPGGSISLQQSWGFSA
jgi:hypothetical protein